MLAKTTTERQRYWLKHVNAADLSNGTIAEYAIENAVSLKGLYQWKTKLLKLKLYPPAVSSPGLDFVAVKPSSPPPINPVIQPAHMDRSGCTVILTNGTQIDFHGELSPGMICSIMTTVSQTH